MIKFYDTCSLLAIANNIKEKFVISSITLQELEDIKNNRFKSEDVRCAARKLLHFLDECPSQWEVVIYREPMEKRITDKFLAISNDTKILACADYYNSITEEVEFVTNDFALKMLAGLFFPKERIISVIPPKENKGFKEVYLNEDELAHLYSNMHENIYDLLENEYLIVYTEDGELVDKLKWRNGALVPIAYGNFDSLHFGKVKPYKDDPYQALLADSLISNKITIVKGRAGSGKAQPNSTLIPTKAGYKKLGSIRPGDYILDRFGNETKVLAIFPQGKKDNYKITFSDGRVSYCNDEHLWTCYTSRGNFKTLTVKEMLSTGLQTSKGIWRYKIPRSSPVEYPEKQYNIDPYVLGAFLGGGCCLQKFLTISSVDEEIVKEIAELIGAKNYHKNSEKNYSWEFYEKDKTKSVTGEFFKGYEKNIVQYSYNKSVPEEYKRGSIKQRYSLLQGLMDTDGHIDSAKKGRIRFSSTSLQLIKDVQEICWSLGMSATINVDERPAEKCYQLCIACPKENKPNLFRLKRKKDIAIDYLNNGEHSIYSDKLTVKQIQKMPEAEEMTCLLVDNDEHLYLTEQYIVTHNSFLSLAYLFSKLSEHKIDKIIIFCNTVAAKGAAKLGFYPGTREEKLLDSQIGNFLASKLGDRSEVEHLIQQGKLEILPASDIRGYDTSGMRAGIYVTEAQNFDISLLKLVLQRIGEDCICILDGDLDAQVDMTDFEGANNGLRRASEVFKGQPIFGQVELQQIHRSRIAEIADQM